MNIRIVKNRSDIGGGTRGSDMGIDAIEVAAINANNPYFTRFSFVDVPSHNETVYAKVHAQFAKRIVFVVEQCERVFHDVKNALDDDCFPIVLSGDHSSAIGTIAAIKTKNPEKRVGVVWIDAHADLHSPYTTPSGNLHGMPLCASLGFDNIECQSNSVTEKTLGNWSKLKDLGTDAPKILPEDIVFYGLRDTEVPENYLINTHGMRVIKVDEFRHRGAEKCIREGMERLSNCDLIYLSFDVDSMDPDRVSKGTGTPVPRGFDPNEVRAIINGFIDTGKVACLEICEVNPLLDTTGNQMAEHAFGVLDDVTEHWLHHNTTAVMSGL